jgi:hypothetical protein
MYCTRTYSKLKRKTASIVSHRDALLLQYVCFIDSAETSSSFILLPEVFLDAEARNEEVDLTIRGCAIESVREERKASVIMASLKGPKGPRTCSRGGSIFRIRKTKTSAADHHIIVKKLTDTTEKSDTLDNVSEVSWDVDDSNSNGKVMDKLVSIHTDSSSLEETLSEVEFWEKVSQERLQNDHPETATADSFSNLGIAQMKGNDVDAACRSFTTAAVKFGQSHLGAAKNYNLLGRAACRAKRLDLSYGVLGDVFYASVASSRTASCGYGGYFQQYCRCLL